jgi:adenine deaminase
MEIANVAGIEGMRVLLHGVQHLPYHILIEVSSRVPTAPGLETTGGELGLDEVRDILTWPECISLGELDPSKVLGLRDEYLAKVEAAHALQKIANGHAAGLSGADLAAYACGGLADDHECVTYEDALARLRLGLSVLIREGSTERNLEPILTGVVREKLDTRHLMFCTDDKHPGDIRDEGHIDTMVNRAIELGLLPMQAIQMATVNAAVHFRCDHLLGSLTPGRWADVILSERLDRIIPETVLFKGQLVAQDGALVIAPPPGEYPDWIQHTVTVTRGKTGADFRLAADGTSAKVRVIELYPDQIINEIGEAVLPVIDGQVMADPQQDVLKLAVVERYGKNGNIGVAFVRGFGLKQGALASSVAHDHHNIIVVGTNDEDMAACVRAIEARQGGLSIANGGAELDGLSLPVGGLLSLEPVKDIIARLERITAIAHDQGCVLPAPFMTISFISLPTVPELGLTDRGLVSVRDHQLIGVFAE